MAEWKPGHVCVSEGSLGPEYKRVAKDQIWTYHRTPGYDGARLWLVVVSTSLEGEVVLRPNGPQEVERALVMFPLKETTFKGKPVSVRDCPFLWRGEGGNVIALLASEGWDVWQRMHMSHDIGASKEWIR
jgi:hypothetical protein